jgi:hypothetical protein
MWIFLTDYWKFIKMPDATEFVNLHNYGFFIRYDRSF